MTTKPETIRAFNDELRQNLTTGTALMNRGCRRNRCRSCRSHRQNYRGLRRFLPLAAPFAYVPNKGSGSLSVIDTATDQVVGEIAAGTRRAAGDAAIGQIGIAGANDFVSLCSAVKSANGCFAKCIHHDLGLPNGATLLFVAPRNAGRA